MEKVTIKLKAVESVYDLQYLDLLYCIQINSTMELPQIWMVESIYKDMPEGRMEIHSFTVIIRNTITKQLWTLTFKEIQEMLDSERLKIVTL
jgi:hypothetical protein